MCTKQTKPLRISLLHNSFTAMSFILIYSFKTHTDKMPLMISVALWWAHTSMSMSLPCWGAQNWAQHFKGGFTSTEQRGRFMIWWQHSSWWSPGVLLAFLTVRVYCSLIFSPLTSGPLLLSQMWCILGMRNIVQTSLHSTHFKTHCRHSKFRVSLYEKVQNELLNSPSVCQLDPVMT